MTNRTKIAIDTYRAAKQAKREGKIDTAAFYAATDDLALALTERESIDYIKGIQDV